MSSLLDLKLETNTCTLYKNIPREIEESKYHPSSLDLPWKVPPSLAHCLLGAPSKDSTQLVLQKWLDGKGLKPASWWDLSDALYRMKLLHLSSTVMANSESLELTMNNLLNHPYEGEVTKSANIPREVGVKYFDFGTHLLQDPTGTHLRDLEHQLFRNGEEINKHILTEWLEGKGRPVTWATLVEVLNIIGMGELAKQIEVRYVKNKATDTKGSARIDIFCNLKSSNAVCI